MKHPRNPKYIHHQSSRVADSIKEIVFGMEDGMVSTLGSITGIAGATHDPFTTILAGVVIVSVESISMGVGEFLSTKSRNEMHQRMLEEERSEIEQFPKEEQEEMEGMFVADGWPRPLAQKMAEATANDKKLMLKEMAYRELKVFPDKKESALKNGIVMLLAYIVGGVIPLAPYFFMAIGPAIIISISITLLGLFMLGVLTTHYSKRNPIKAGLEMFTLASVAAVIGYVVGKLVDATFLQ
ncbi:VIT1/CCC1 transporter family protein [Candidatus Nomurabacteria bacterium]|nr:VIT1/CCC1 transporter family protein [Candidatus Nomurabacteria bacterium]